MAIAAAERGRKIYRKIYFGSLTDLVNSLDEAKARGRARTPPQDPVTHPTLLVVDADRIPAGDSGAVLFFQFINRRYECASTVLTSNKGFEEWGPHPSATR